ncbi:hypothetical protein ABT369_28560 [Dactylosporangium sp. NPDC000244]|uniref:hypothetical protein n=1 Tax=Dactylosporangium sp. NPDC000244 TaxID=3154365 RepID=UPI003319864C
MTARAVINALLYVAGAPGGALAAYCTAYVLSRRASPAGRIWGRMSALPPAPFLVYFGVLGLAWFFCAQLLTEWRRDLTAVVLALAGISVVQIAVWVVAATRRPHSQA